MQLFFTHVRPGQIKPFLQVAIMYFYTRKRGDFIRFFVFWVNLRTLLATLKNCLPCSNWRYVEMPLCRIIYHRQKKGWKLVQLLLKFQQANLDTQNWRGLMFQFSSWSLKISEVFIIFDWTNSSSLVVNTGVLREASQVTKMILPLWAGKNLVELFVLEGHCFFSKPVENDEMLWVAVWGIFDILVEYIRSSSGTVCTETLVVEFNLPGIKQLLKKLKRRAVE